MKASSKHVSWSLVNVSGNVALITIRSRTYKAMTTAKDRKTVERDDETGLCERGRPVAILFSVAPADLQHNSGR